jgi:hypothetical protein
MSKKLDSKRLESLFDEIPIPASEPVRPEPAARPSALGIPVETAPTPAFAPPRPQPAEAHAKGEPCCPHIGLLNDPQTSLTYPCEWNMCHRASPPAPPNLDHQRVYCLVRAYQPCPFLRGKPGTPLPEYIRMPR